MMWMWSWSQLQYGEHAPGSHLPRISPAFFCIAQDDPAKSEMVHAPGWELMPPHAVRVTPTRARGKTSIFQQSIFRLLNAAATGFSHASQQIRVPRLQRTSCLTAVHAQDSNRRERHLTPRHAECAPAIDPTPCQPHGGSFGLTGEKPNCHEAEIRRRCHAKELRWMRHQTQARKANPGQGYPATEVLAPPPLGLQSLWLRILSPPHAIR